MRWMIYFIASPVVDPETTRMQVYVGYLGNFTVATASLIAHVVASLRAATQVNLYCCGILLGALVTTRKSLIEGRVRPNH